MISVFKNETNKKDRFTVTARGAVWTGVKQVLQQSTCRLQSCNCCVTVKQPLNCYRLQVNGCHKR